MNELPTIELTERDSEIFQRILKSLDGAIDPLAIVYMVLKIEHDKRAELRKEDFEFKESWEEHKQNLDDLNFLANTLYCLS